MQREESALLPARQKAHRHDEHAEDAHDEDEHDEHEHDEHEHEEHEHAKHDEHDEHDEHEHDEDEHAEDAHEHETAYATDPHLWLSVANAHAIARIIARELAQVDPANRARYQKHARALSDKLNELQKDLQQTLRPVAGAPYVVFHDAYQYFEKEFGLQPAGIVRLNPHTPAGAAHVREVRRLMTERGARCVFSEPQFPPGLAARLAKDTGAQLGVLDPLGASLPPGAGAWFALMRELADSLRDCLAHQ